MIKGILLSVIMAACACAGRMLANGKKRRADTLHELLTGMRVLRLRMLNSMEPLGILLRKSDSALLRELGDSLWEGASLAECWEKKRGEECRRGHMLDSLGDGDIEILDHFFRSLGGSGREEQNEMFSGVIARMEEAQSSARRLFQDANKTYTALGALLGVAICIIIV